MKFREIANRVNRQPPGFVLVDPEDFASTWDDRPKSAVAIGVRLLSDEETTQAKVAAADVAVRQHNEDMRITTELYNDALMSGVVTACMCDPNDYSKRPKLFPIQEEKLTRAVFTSAAIRYIFEKEQELEVVYGSGHREADPETIAFLLDHAEDISTLESADGIAIRRHLQFAANLLRDSLEVRRAG